MEAITLNNLAIGQKATIITVGGEGILRRRFLDMGLTPKQGLWCVKERL